MIDKRPLLVFAQNEYVFIIDLFYDAVATGLDRFPRIARDDRLHARSNDRGGGVQKRHCLALHVRTHKRAVSIVMLQKRNQRRRYARDHTGAKVYQRNILTFSHDVFAVFSDLQKLLYDIALFVQFSGRRSDYEPLFLRSGKIDDLVGDLAVYDLFIRSFNEA